MSASNYEVVDILMLVGNVLPLAVYFLVLGLVNSHARPFLISSRSDFLALTSVLLPVLIWPVPDFIRGGLYLLLLVGMLLAGLVFLYLLPARHAGFVVYNISRSRCLKLLEQSIRSLGLEGRWQGSVFTTDDLSLSMEVREFSILHNVALHMECRSDRARLSVHELGADLDRRLHTVSQLPSTMGAGLVLVGVSLLILPMWMVGRHIHDLVDAMTHLFG